MEQLSFMIGDKVKKGWVRHPLKDRDFDKLTEYIKRNKEFYIRAKDVQDIQFHEVIMPRPKMIIEQNDERIIKLNPYYNSDFKIKLIEQIDKYHEIKGMPLKYNLPLLKSERLIQKYGFLVSNTSYRLDASFIALEKVCGDYPEMVEEIETPPELDNPPFDINNKFLKRYFIYTHLKNLTKQ